MDSIEFGIRIYQDCLQSSFTTGILGNLAAAVVQWGGLAVGRRTVNFFSKAFVGPDGKLQNHDLAKAMLNAQYLALIDIVDISLHEDFDALNCIFDEVNTFQFNSAIKNAKQEEVKALRGLRATLLSEQKKIDLLDENSLQSLLMFSDRDASKVASLYSSDTLNAAYAGWTRKSSKAILDWLNTIYMEYPIPQQTIARIMRGDWIDMYRSSFRESLKTNTRAETAYYINVFEELQSSVTQSSQELRMQIEKGMNESLRNIDEVRISIELLRKGIADLATTMETSKKLLVKKIDQASELLRINLSKQEIHWKQLQKDHRRIQESLDKSTEQFAKLEEEISGFLNQKVHGILLWDASDQSPEVTIPGRMIYGQRAEPSHLSQGYFLRRPELQSSLLNSVVDWVDSVGKREEPLKGIPVFWIQGDSGSGKSVALLHLAADLKQIGHVVLWLGATIVNLPKAFELARILKSPRPAGTKVIIVLDDPFAPDSDRKYWEVAYGFVSDLIATDNRRDLPYIVCCGPTDHRSRFKRELEMMQVVELAAPFSVGRLASEERRQFIKFLSARLSIDILRDAEEETVEDLPVLLAWRWAWPEKGNLQFFLTSFLKKRLELDKDADLRQFFVRLLILNRLYVGVPSQLYDKLNSELREKLRTLLKELHLTEDDDHYSYASGLRLAHAQIANLLYECWLESQNNVDDIVRGEHLADAIIACAGLDAIEDRSAPLEGFSTALNYRASELKLDGEVAKTFVNIAWPSWQLRLRDDIPSNHRALTAWMRIFTRLETSIANSILVHPAIFACDFVDLINEWNHQLRSLCRIISIEWSAFPTNVQQSIVSRFKERVEKIRVELLCYNNDATWYIRWRIGQELEMTLNNIDVGSSSIYPLISGWLLQHGATENAASLWERYFAVGIHGTPKEQIPHLLNLLNIWLSSHYTHPRWQYVWSHAARWRRYLSNYSFEFDKHFSVWCNNRLESVEDASFPSVYASLCRFTNDRQGRFFLGNAATIKLRSQGIQWLKKSREIDGYFQVVSAILHLRRSKSPGAKTDSQEDMEKLISDSEFLLKLLELDPRLSRHWKHIWLPFVELLDRVKPESRNEHLEEGWKRIKDKHELPDWPYIAQRLFQYWDKDCVHLPSLLESTQRWLMAYHEHPSWNYLFRAVLATIDQSESRCSILVEGQKWLDSNPNSPQWNYVFQAMASRNGVTKATDKSYLMNRGLRWLRDDQHQSRNGWIIVYESVIAQFNDSIRYGTERSVLLELPIWFIEDGTRYLRNNPYEPGVEGVISDLLRSGSTSKELSGASSWIQRHIFQNPIVNSWVVLVALARRPDDLPASIRVDQVLVSLLEYLKSKPARRQLSLIAQWKVVRDLTDWLGNAYCPKNAIEIAIECLSQTHQPRELILDILFSRWSIISEVDRKKVDEFLVADWSWINGLVKSWGKTKDFEEKSHFAPIWTLFAYRLEIGEIKVDSSCEITRLELWKLADRWVNLAYDSKFEGAPKIASSMFRLFGSDANPFVLKVVKACCGLLPAFDAHKVWLQIVSRLALFVDVETLKNLMTEGESLIGVLDSKCALGIWQVLWRTRNQTNRSESELIKIAIGVINRASKDVWRSVWSSVVESLSLVPPEKPVWDLVEVAAFRHTQETDQKGIMSMVVESCNVLVPAEQLHGVICMVQNELNGVSGVQYNTRLVINSERLLEHKNISEIAPEDIDDFKSIAYRALFESTTNQFMGGFDSMQVAARLARSPEQLGEIKQAFFTLLNASESKPFTWALKCWEILHEAKRFERIVDSTAFEDIINKAYRWLKKHPHAKFWPKLFLGLSFHASSLGSFRMELQSAGIARLKAMASDDNGWPLVFNALKEFGIIERVLPYGRSKVLNGSVRTRGFGTVLFECLSRAQNDPELLNRARMYLASVDPSRYSYEKIAVLVRDIESAKSVMQM